VHEFTLRDGIDIGLGGTAAYTALIDGNTAFNLTQSGPLTAGILSDPGGRHADADTSRLTATVSNNTQHDIGTANLQHRGPRVRLSQNVVDASTHRPPTSQQPLATTAWAAGRERAGNPDDERRRHRDHQRDDSSFTDVTSDIIEPIALGTNQYLEVNLLRVTAARANARAPRR